MIGAHRVQNDLEIVQELVEAIHVAARPLGPSVPALVIGMHRTAAAGKPARHLFVASAVLRVAVDQQQSAVRALGKPAAAQQAETALNPELRLDPAQISDRLDQDGTSRRSRSRAARTRFRYVTPRMFEPQK